MNTVLIAADRDLEQNLIAQALGTRGFTVIRSRDGLEALETARANPPQILVANVSLPRMDGFALFRRCQQDEHLQDIPFILYSPRSNDEKSERFALELGATRFVSNALKPETLWRAVEEVLAANAAKNISAEPKADVRATPASAQVISLEARQLREQSHKLQQELQTNQTQLLALQQQLQAAQLQIHSVQTQLAEANQAAQFVALFNANPVAMWLVNKSSQAILAANEAALRLFGYDHQEFLNLSNEALLRNHSITPTSTTVLAFQHRDGGLLSLTLYSREMAFAGQAAELIAAHDVSYRVRGERSIVDELQRVKALLAAIPTPYWVIDGDGKLLEVNELYCRQSGYRRDELIGQYISQLLATSPAAALEAIRQNTWQSQPVALKYKDGTQHPAELILAATETHDGPRLAIIHAEAAADSRAMSQAGATHARLSTVLEMLRYADDADEATLLQYAVAQLAAAFGSAVALFATVDRTTRTLNILALSDAFHKRSPGAAIGTLAIPEAWREPFAQRRAETCNALSGAITLDGLPTLTRYIACPVSGRREQCLLLVANRETDYSDVEQQELLDCAEILAALLALKRHHLRTQGLQQQAQADTEALIALLSRLIDRHDPFAAGSGMRIANLAIAIARELGVPAERYPILQLAAQLHDVGHLSMPQALLLRPTDLTAAECALLETHAEQGALLLSGLALDPAIGSVVAQHHERVDGTGYPRGLQGADISLEAKIIAVADVVEAMCATRAYRPALGLNAALAELAKGNGRTYDSSVVAACTRIFEATQQQWPA